MIGQHQLLLCVELLQGIGNLRQHLAHLANAAIGVLPLHTHGCQRLDGLAIWVKACLKRLDAAPDALHGLQNRILVATNARHRAAPGIHLLDGHAQVRAGALHGDQAIYAPGHKALDARHGQRSGHHAEDGITHLGVTLGCAFKLLFAQLGLLALLLGQLAILFALFLAALLVELAFLAHEALQALHGFFQLRFKLGIIQTQCDDKGFYNIHGAFSCWIRFWL